MMHSQVATTGSRSRRGFTLTEIAIVLGILGIVLGAIWTAAAMAYRDLKINKEVQEIATIVQNVRSLYATRQSFASSAYCIQQLMISSNSFPAEMVNPAAPADPICSQPAVSDPWGNYVEVGTQWGWNGLPGSVNYFEINVGQNVTNAQCSAVLSAIVSSATASAGLVGVGAGGIGETQDMSTITDPSYFQGCSGDFTLQYSLK